MTDPTADALAPWSARFCLPVPARRVVVGCSGGPDSLALLALAAAAGLDVVAVHVDHGLRAHSQAEAEVVREAASRFGALSGALRVEVAPGPGLEARAREARLAALEERRRAEGADAVLLGHTRDDQAETVLLNLLRGAATTGLAGIPPVRGSFVHPLLDLARADTIEICARLRLTPVHDPMNDDPAFRRVWLRREVVPFLEAGTGADLRAILARQAQILREESALLDALADQELTAADAGRAGGGRDGEGVAPSLPCAAVTEPDRALARRVVRRWLGHPPPSVDEVDAVLAVARGEHRAVELAGGVRVERSSGALRCVAGAGSDAVEATLPGPVRFGTLHLETWVERAPPVAWPRGEWTCVLDADAVGADVRLQRSRLPGRGGHAVLTDGAGTPLWVVGYRVAAPGRVTPTTRRYLWAHATLEAGPSPTTSGAGDLSDRDPVIEAQ